MPPIDKKADLDNNNNAFAEDERQIGTTPIIEMTTDTGVHPPIAKKPYTLAFKHYDWVKEEIDKLLEVGVIRESHLSWSALIIVVPKGDGGKRLCVVFRTLNKSLGHMSGLCLELKTHLLNLEKLSFIQLLTSDQGITIQPLTKIQSRKQLLLHHLTSISI